MQIIYEEGELSEDQVREMLREKAVEVGGQAQLGKLTGTGVTHINQTVNNRSSKRRGEVLVKETHVTEEMANFLGLIRQKRIIYTFKKIV